MKSVKSLLVAFVIACCVHFAGVANAEAPQTCEEWVASWEVGKDELRSAINELTDVVTSDDPLLESLRPCLYSISDNLIKRIILGCHGGIPVAAGYVSIIPHAVEHCVKESVK